MGEKEDKELREHKTESLDSIGNNKMISISARRGSNNLLVTDVTPNASTIAHTIAIILPKIMAC